MSRAMLEYELFHDKSRLVRADLHNHWRTSSWVRPSDLEKAAIRARKAMGAGAVIGLVNFEDERFERTIDMAKKTDCAIQVDGASNGVYLPRYDVLVVKGQEVPTESGHVLFLGLDRDVFLQRGIPVQERTLVDTLKEGRKHGAISIIDHPFYKDGLFSTGKKTPISHAEMVQLVDAYEIHNGEAAFSVPRITPAHANDTAWNEFYKKGGIRDTFPNMFTTVSTDGHHFWEIGSSNMEIPMPHSYVFRNSQELRDALIYGISQNHGRALDVDKRESWLGGAMHAGELAGVLGANYQLAKRLPGVLAKPFKYLDGKFRDDSYNDPRENTPVSDFC